MSCGCVGWVGVGCVEEWRIGDVRTMHYIKQVSSPAHPPLCLSALVGQQLAL